MFQKLLWQIYFSGILEFTVSGWSWLLLTLESNCRWFNVFDDFILSSSGNSILWVRLGALPKEAAVVHGFLDLVDLTRRVSHFWSTTPYPCVMTRWLTLCSLRRVKVRLTGCPNFLTFSNFGKKCWLSPNFTCIVLIFTNIFYRKFKVDPY